MNRTEEIDYMGVSINGGIQNGWFLLGKIRMRFGGAAMTQETPISLNFYAVQLGFFLGQHGMIWDNVGYIMWDNMV